MIWTVSVAIQTSERKPGSGHSNILIFYTNNLNIALLKTLRMMFRWPYIAFA